MKYDHKIVSAYFKECGLPEPTFEYRFHPVRRWRFDLAFFDYMVYVEIDGGIWTAGGHNRGEQMKKDWEKRNTAACMGWRGLTFEPKDICMKETVDMIKECLQFTKNRKLENLTNSGKARMVEVTNESVRMRKPVKDIYDRQSARCLSDIEELYDVPSMVKDRIKRAIEYTAKDVDKINKKESGYGQIARIDR